MMRVAKIGPILLTAALALAGCGGGGSGSGVASPGSSPPPITPPPTSPPPSATNAIIPLATTSQQFAVAGASGGGNSGAQSPLDASEQLQVRYVAPSNSYEVQLPGSQDWVAVSYSSTPDPLLIDYQGGAFLFLRNYGYLYSRLMEWSGGDHGGHEAIGIATPAGGVPMTGSATYEGQILGSTTEEHSPDDVFIDGTFAMTFNFGAGTLSGTMSPVVHRDFAGFPIGAVNFRDTVYSHGGTTFSGRFDTNLPGTNGFNGQLTGPNAQELIGGFALPYQSPIDNQTYQSDGAFVGAR